MTEHTVETIADPAERAVANGYKEAPAPTRDERIKSAIAAIEHANKHNSPLDRLVIADIKELLAFTGEAKGE